MFLRLASRRALSTSNFSPVCAQASPYAAEVIEGKTYAWCSCGLSKKQPLCDGEHRRKETGMSPVRWKCEKNAEVFFCGCKLTKNPPFCDGSHNSL